MNSNGVTRKLCCIGAALLMLWLHAYPQKIQYSRQNFRLPYSDGMQLVADISGFHHVLSFAVNQQPAIYIFDAQLQLHSKKVLQFTLRQSNDVKIIPFPGFYYLYIHQTGSTKHELWRIDPEGDRVALSEMFQQVIETSLNKNTATLQLVNKNNQLFIIGNTYYDAIEKIGSTVVQVDKNLKVEISKNVFYSFKLYEEQLKQLMLAGDDLLILKTANDSIGNSLQLIKADLETGTLLTSFFYSGSNAYQGPAFRYNAIDSSIIIYSMIQSTVFITKLNHLLDQVEPITYLKKQFSKNVSDNFLLVNGKTPQWISVSNSNIRFRRNATSPYDRGFDNNIDQTDAGRWDDYLSKMPQRQVSGAYRYNVNSNSIPAIRFSLLNAQFKLINDSIVANDKASYTLRSGQYANVMLGKKSYLFLAQTFFNKNHGLLMISENGGNYLSARDIRVFEKYEYLLPQLKAVNNEYVILPFTYKREVGLVKITLDK